MRGGGWASDMLLRPASTERLRAELRYMREMGLNTIRLEGKLESDEFYDLADEYGILVMPGWCCCDQWELWNKWDAEDYRVGARVAPRPDPAPAQPSERAGVAERQRLPAAREVEKAYLDVLKDLRWSKPVLSRTQPTRRGRSAARAA